MKILFLNTLDDPAGGGGAEVTLWTLIRALTAAGHQCVLLATSDSSGLSESERDGVRIWRAGMRNIYWPGKRTSVPSAARVLWHAFDSFNPLMQGYLNTVLKKEKPDIVSIHNLPGWSSAAWNTVLKSGIPSVQVLHDQYALCPKSSMFRDGHNCQSQCVSCRMFRLPHRALSNGVSAVVGVSQFILNRHIDHGYFEKVPLRFAIPNARDPDSLGLNTVASPHEGFRLGFIGRLDSTKGVELLIEAFRAYDRYDAELWIAGAGKLEYEATLRVKAADRRIRFLGRMAPSDFYPQVDVVVTPSLWNEPLGMVVAEAMAFGKPVIGSTRGGIPEMIQHRKNGLLFDPDMPGDLLQALQLLGINEGLRKQLGLGAGQSSKSFLDTNKWIGQYGDVYGKVLRYTF